MPLANLCSDVRKDYYGLIDPENFDPSGILDQYLEDQDPGLEYDNE